MKITKERAVEILRCFSTVEKYANKDESSKPFRRGITSNRMRLLTIGNEHDALLNKYKDDWKANEGMWSELMYRTDQGYAEEADNLMHEHFLNSTEYKDFMATEMDFLPYQITIDEVLDGTNNLPMNILLMYAEIFVEERTAAIV